MKRKDFIWYLNELKVIWHQELEHPVLKEIKLRLDNKMNNEIIFQNFQLAEKLIKKSSTILDFGFGGGYMDVLIRKLNKKSKIFALDTFIHDDIDDKKEKIPAYIRELKQKILNLQNQKYHIQYKYYNGEDLPYKDNKFDLIFAYAVMEHIAPEKRFKIIEEWCRILNNGGYVLILRLPRYFSIAEFIARRLKIGHHLWVFSKQDVYNLFNQHFTIEKIKIVDSTFCNPQKIANILSCLLQPLDRFFASTQLNYLGHDYSVVLKKKQKK